MKTIAQLLKLQMCSYPLVLISHAFLRWPDYLPARSQRASMAKLHSTAISCAETGNSLIADHWRSVCKLTEPNISKARLLCYTQRATTSFSVSFFMSRAAMLKKSSATHQPTATLTSGQWRDKSVLFLSLSLQFWEMPSSCSTASAS